MSFQTLAGHPVLQQVKTALLKEAAERPCYPKVRYETAAEADSTLDTLRAAGKSEDGAKTLNRYGPCRFCRGFHLGRTRREPTPLEGNHGTVSFEAAVIGAPDPVRPESRKQRRARLKQPLPAIQRGKYGTGGDE